MAGGSPRLADFAAEHSVALTRFAYLVCGDRGLAEDLVQDALMSLYRRFGDLVTVAAPVAYVRRAIVNGSISHARRRVPVAVAELPDTSIDAVDGGEQDAMWRVLATLPPKQRTVLVLRYYLDLPDDEIAAALDCRPGTVRSLAARAFAVLRVHPELDAPHRPEAGR